MKYIINRKISRTVKCFFEFIVKNELKKAVMVKEIKQIGMNMKCILILVCSVMFVFVVKIKRNGMDKCLLVTMCIVLLAFMVKRKN